MVTYSSKESDASSKSAHLVNRGSASGLAVSKERKLIIVLGKSGILPSEMSETFGNSDRLGRIECRIEKLAPLRGGLFL